MPSFPCPCSTPLPSSPGLVGTVRATILSRRVTAQVESAGRIDRFSHGRVLSLSHQRESIAKVSHVVQLSSSCSFLPTPPPVLMTRPQRGHTCCARSRSSASCPRGTMGVLHAAHLTAQAAVVPLTHRMSICAERTAACFKADIRSPTKDLGDRPCVLACPRLHCYRF